MKSAPIVTAGLVLLLAAAPVTAGPLSALGKLLKAGKAAGKAGKAARAAKAVAGAAALTGAARAARGISTARAAGMCLKAAEAAPGRALVYVAKEGKAVKYFVKGSKRPVLVGKPGELSESLQVLRSKVKLKDGSASKGLDLHVEDDLFEGVAKATQGKPDNVLLANLDGPSWKTRPLSKTDPSRVAPVPEGYLIKLGKNRRNLGTYRRFQGCANRPSQTRVLSDLGADDAKRLKERLEALGELYDPEPAAPQETLEAGRIAVIVGKRGKSGGVLYRGQEHSIKLSGPLIKAASAELSALVVVVVNPEASEQATSELLARLQEGLGSSNLTKLVGSLTAEGETLVAEDPGSFGDATLRFVPAPDSNEKGAQPHPISEVVLYAPRELIRRWEEGGDGKDQGWECLACCVIPIGLVLLLAGIGWIGEKLGWIEPEPPEATPELDLA